RHPRSLPRPRHLPHHSPTPPTPLLGPLTGHITPNHCTLSTSVTTHVTTLCPCSKTISDYGAHNQRSHITLTITGNPDSPYPLPVHHIIHLLRNSGSAPVIPLVKRPDERIITMDAYDHPLFVEDIIRNISLTCRKQNLTHQITAKNLESIHSHNAIATITHTLQTPTNPFFTEPLPS
ncbi:GTP cyclohydrolase, FolE2/MptA family, partial [Streptomyces californicus]|uniref:GTP cyclohydrolase, FolE2/MptA family n=1 Tax=Streptomyces californicus TaxID=67351 RepID=UPI00296F23E5